MKVKTAVLAIALLTSTGLTACCATTEVNGVETTGTTTEQSGTGVTRQALVDESKDGHVIEVSAGALVTVRLESNATTGFRWELAEPIEEGMLALIESRYVPPGEADRNEEAVGAEGMEEWTFETLKPGETTISMAYSRPWEGGEKGSRTFTLTVRSLSGRAP